jgi:primosomal protein N' (replication factor Y)
LKKKNGVLTCGYCGETSQAPEQCPGCGKKLRPGRIRGTQYLKEQLEETFPEETVEVLEEGVKETRVRQIVRQIRSGKTKLLVGTEYALDRLPEELFSLAVLINPENSLNLPDFRASEKTFATIYRLSELVRNDSRARAVAVVTGPEPEVISQALTRNYRFFFEREIEYRHLLSYPPFSCLVEVNLHGSSLRSSGRGSRQLVDQLRNDFPALEIIGPRITRQAWRKEKKEIKLFLRVPSREQLVDLLMLLKKFRLKRPALRIGVKVWK